MVTMQDVARAAGVSVATVSRVLTGARAVRPEHEAAVRKASAALGYRMNHVASSLRRQCTNTVGMVVPQIANPFFPGVVQAVEHQLEEDGRALLLCDSRNNVELERQRVHALLDRQVDGLLIIPCDERASAAAVAEAMNAAPTVQVDRYVAEAPTDVVTADQAAGVNAAVAHLHDIGRARLAFVGAAVSSSTGRERRDAFRVACHRLGLRSAVEHLGDFSIEWGREAALALTAGDTPDGVVCANDLIAIGVLRGLQGAGWRVPADVAVTGFDDIGFAQVCEPPLTTVRQPLAELGAAALRLLDDRLADRGAAPREDRIIPHLVVRASTQEVAA